MEATGFFIPTFKIMIAEICMQLKEMLKKEQNYNQKMEVWVVQITTISILLKKHENEYESLVSK